MQLLKGKPAADRIKDHAAKIAENLLAKNIVPTLGILRVGNNESDIAYENSAIKTAKNLGINVEKYIMDGDSKTDDVLDVLKVMNDDSNIHGILIFRPLPEQIDEEKIRNHINPAKDVDGISDASVGGLFTGNRQGFPPCTAEAALLLLEHYGIELKGKRATVIGRSLVIGKPAAMMLMEKDATVTICHSKTDKRALETICRESDIILCAAGKVDTLNAAHVNGNQVIIDVGINFNEEGKMCGDANFEALSGNVAAITPVPGGVGSVTTAILMYHVVKAAESGVV